MYLFFDTETSGLPRSWNAPVSQLDNWPRLVQIGWIVCDKSGRQTASGEHLIRPDGFVIARDATARHGITTAFARQHGVALRPVLDEFAAFAATASVLVGHNLSFDACVVGSELLRAGRRNVLERKQQRCTMRETTDWCRLPGPRGYKWPTLTELHQKLFRRRFDGAHGALADASACMKCYFKLRELGVLT